MFIFYDMNIKMSYFYDPTSLLINKINDYAIKLTNTIFFSLIISSNWNCYFTTPQIFSITVYDCTSLPPPNPNHRQNLQTWKKNIRVSLVILESYCSYFYQNKRKKNFKFIYNTFFLHYTRPLQWVIFSFFHFNLFLDFGQKFSKMEKCAQIYVLTTCTSSFLMVAYLTYYDNNSNMIRISLLLYTYYQCKTTILFVFLVDMPAVANGICINIKCHFLVTGSVPVFMYGSIHLQDTIYTVFRLTISCSIIQT